MTKILLSNQEVFGDVKGPGRAFMTEFWDKIEDSTEYNASKTNLLDSVSEGISEYTGTDGKIYFKTKLDGRYPDDNNQYIAKSRRPSKIIESCDLEIVGSSDNNEITLSGNLANFESFKGLINQSTYAQAKISDSKEKTIISREIYTMKSLVPTINLNRVTKGITDSFELDPSTRLRCTIFFEQDCLVTEHDTYIKLIKGHLSQDNKNNIKLNSKILIKYSGTLSILTYINDNELSKIISDKKLSSISQIRRDELAKSQRSLSKLDFNFTRDDLDTEEIVCVVDGGCVGEHITPYIHGTTINMLENYHTPDNEHGEAVASIVLYGNQLDIARATGAGEYSLSPACRILDLTVLFTQETREYSNDDFGRIIDGLELVIKRFGSDIHIFNLSLGGEQQQAFDEKHTNDFSVAIDRMAREHDKIFVVSSGNHDKWFSATGPGMYIDDVANDPTNSLYIRPPADAINTISVGGFSQYDDEYSLSKIKEASPISCFGNRRSGCESWMKPEIIAGSGNIHFSDDSLSNEEILLLSERKYGSLCLSGNSLNRNNGTSFAAPIITNKLVYIISELKKTYIREKIINTNNLLNFSKGLLIHSTRRMEQTTKRKFEDYDNKDWAYGFGETLSHNTILTDAENELNFVHTGAFYATQEQIDAKEKKHKITFKLGELFNGRKMRISCTISYNPPINGSFSDRYKMTNLLCSLKRKKRIPTYNKKGKEVWYTDIKSNYYLPHNNFNIFQVEQDVIGDNFDLEVFLDFTIHEAHLKRNENNISELTQPYCIFVTILDLEGNTDLREEFIRLNNMIEIEIDQKIEVSNIKAKKQ